MKETIPQSQFEYLAYKAAQREDMIGYDTAVRLQLGQAAVFAMYNVQLELW